MNSTNLPLNWMDQYSLTLMKDFLCTKKAAKEANKVVARLHLLEGKSVEWKKASAHANKCKERHEGAARRLSDAGLSVPSEETVRKAIESLSREASRHHENSMMIFGERMFSEPRVAKECNAKLHALCALHKAQIS